MANNSPIINFENVTRILTDEVIPVTLVKDINLTINKGEFVAVTGPSGSGKSSLMYLMGLLDKQTSGKIYIDAVDTIKAADFERERIRLIKLGFVFQFHFLLPEFSVLDNILLPMRKLKKLTYEKMVERAEYLLGYFNLKDAAYKKPHQMSGGERQRVSIARAMANDPLIILADEPSGDLDSKNAHLVFDLFACLCAEEQKTIVAITHDLELAKLTKRQVHLLDGTIHYA